MDKENYPWGLSDRAGSDAATNASLSAVQQLGDMAFRGSSAGPIKGEEALEAGMHDFPAVPAKLHRQQNAGTRAR